MGAVQVRPVGGVAIFRGITVRAPFGSRVAIIGTCVSGLGDAVHIPRDTRGAADGGLDRLGLGDTELSSDPLTVPPQPAEPLADWTLVSDLVASPLFGDNIPRQDPAGVQPGSVFGASHWPRRALESNVTIAVQCIWSPTAEVLFQDSVEVSILRPSVSLSLGGGSTVLLGNNPRRCHGGGIRVEQQHIHSPGMPDLPAVILGRLCPAQRRLSLDPTVVHDIPDFARQRWLARHPPSVLHPLVVPKGRRIA